MASSAGNEFDHLLTTARLIFDSGCQDDYGTKKVMGGSLPPSITRKARGFQKVAKPELGTKRICPETDRKFYDLNKDPIVSPYTGKEYPLSYFEETISSAAAAKAEKAELAKASKEAEAKAKAATEIDEDADDDDIDDIEIVSLEEADDEIKGSKSGDSEIPDLDDDDDVEIDDDDVEIEDDDDDTFLEDDDDDDDVIDIIGVNDDDDET